MICQSTLVQHEQLLFEDSIRPMRFWLEVLELDQPVGRKDVTLWEELFFLDGCISWNGNTFQESYFCAPPGEPISNVKAVGGKASLLRLAYKSNLPLKGKPLIVVEPSLTRQLVWNEIPSRSQHDPGGRVAELFRNENGQQITSLMECRPGWILEEHDHASDVFCFCIRGGGRLSLGNQTIILSEKQLVRIPAGTRHRFETGQHGAFLIIFVFESFTGEST